MWSKVARVFAVELQQQYSLMRLDRFTVDNIMKYLYGEQISAIPERNYNIDMKTKYLNFGSSYLYACHGSREQHIKKWIRERLVYCDTLMKYTSSTSDFITLRSSKLGYVYLDIQTYIPMYLTIKWRDEPDIIINGQVTNAGKQTKKIAKGETVRFEYTMPTATDQEIVVYAGRYLKSLGDVSNLEPTTMLLANANKLTTVTCHSANLINTDLSQLKNVQNIDLSNCTALGSGVGAQPTLNLAECNYLKKVDIYNTQLTAIYTNLSGGSIEEIYYPATVQAINLRNQERLRVIGIPYGYNNLIKNDNITRGKIFYYSQYGAPNIDDSRENNVNGVLWETYIEVEKNTDYCFAFNYSKIFFELWTRVQAYDENKKYLGQYIKVNDYITSGNIYKKSFNTSVFPSCKYIRVSVSCYGVQGNVAPDQNEIIKSSRISKLTIIDIFQECTNLANVDVQNCPNIERFSRYITTDDTFLTLKYVQNLTLKNAAKFTSISFGAFKRLTSLTLTNMNYLTSCGFDDMNNVGDTAVLGSVTIQNCPLINDLTFNVTSSSKTILFTQNAKLDLSQAYTLKRIISNTAIKGLKTIILNRDIQDILLAKTIGTDNSDIKNIWSYSVATANETEGYLGIDFKDINIKNLDLGSALLIPNTKNFYIAPTTAMNIQGARDGVTYPFLPVNGTIDLTNFSGSCVNLFKNVDLTNVTIIKSNDFTQTDFTSMFEGAKISPNTDITSLMSKIKRATNCTRMFTNSNITVPYMPSGFTTDAKFDYMFQNTQIATLSNFSITGYYTALGMFGANSKLTSIDNVTIDKSGVALFSNCPLLVTVNNLTINSGDCTSMLRQNPLLENAKITLKEGCINTSFMFYNCTKLTNINGLIIPDTVIDISNMFTGCTLLKDISGMTFGSRITTATSWIPPNLETANNITMKNSYVKFKDCTTLKDVNNFTFSSTSLYQTFSGCIKLLNINNFTFNSNTTECMSLFLYCTSLVEVDLSKCNFDNVYHMGDMFRQCTSLKKISNLTLNSNPKTYGWLYQNNYTIGIELHNFIINNNEVLIKPLGTDCALFKSPIITKYISKVVNLTLGPNVTNLTSVFEGETLLKEDIDIPLHVTNVTNMFKGCTAMTSVKSNWKKTYPSGFVSTDCYAGCTGITTIDGQNVIAYQGDFGTDYIPIAWGGNGFDKDLTTVIEIKIPTANYSFRPVMYGYNLTNGYETVNANRINWGDGSVTSMPTTGVSGAYQLSGHTYVNPGTYYVKGHFYFGDYNNINEAITCCTKILNTATYTRGSRGTIYEKLSSIWFKGLSNVTEITLPSELQNMEELFSGCTKLSVINGLSTLNTSNVTSMFKAFSDCPAITSIDFIKNWNLSKVTNMSSMFNNCTGITTVNLSGLNTPALTTGRALFNLCINLIDVDLSNWNAPLCTDFGVLFNSCNKLTNVNLVGAITSSATSMASLFFGCSKLTNINGLNALNLNKITSISNMFYGCSSLTTLQLNVIPDSVTDITSLFKNCTLLKDISGITFGSGITTTDSWFPPNLERANNVTIKNNTVTFKDCANLIECKNLTHTNTYLYQLFANCVNLITVEGLNAPNATILSNLFLSCSKLDYVNFSKINFNNVTSMSDMLRGMKTGLIVENLVLGNKLTLQGMERWLYTNDVTINNIFIPNNLVAQNFDNYCYLNYNLKNITGVTFSPTVTDISGMLDGASKILNDFDIPTHITNVTNCFKGCTAMTSVRSNWKKTYTNGITSTDCYAGCTGITTVDGVNVISNAYTSGLDEIPKAWGGYEFSKEFTGIYEIVVPSANYTVTFGELVGDGTVSWGDGQVTTTSYTHTYVNAGTYIVKGKINPNYGVRWTSDTLTNVLTKVYQVSNNITMTSSQRGHFSECKKLTYIDISNTKFVGNCLDYFLYNCINLITVKANNCDFSNIILMEQMFDGCSKLTNIEGVNTWTNLNRVQTMFKLFDYCSSLTSLNLNNWNTSNVTSMSNMFSNCSSLTSLDLSGWSVSNVTNMTNIFAGCSGLTSINLNNWNVSKVEYADGMFSKCSSLTTLDLSSLSFTSLQRFGYMFEECVKLTSIKLPSINTIKTTLHVSYTPSLFYNCNQLTTIEGLDRINTQYVQSLNFWFAYCSKLEYVNLSNMNFSRVNSFSNMFYRCTLLKGVNFTNVVFPTLDSLGGPPNLVDMSYMFSNCTAITSLSNLTGFELFNFITVGNMSSMFNSTNIVTLDIRSWDTRNVTSFQSFCNNNMSLRTIHVNFSGAYLSFLHTSYDVTLVGFHNCTMTVEDYLFPFMNRGKFELDMVNVTITNIDASGGRFSSNSVISVESIMKWLNALSNRTSTTTGTCTIGSTNLAKLTPAQIAVATNKNWTVI